MWEFSWLVRRQGAEAEYADWDRVLDEAAARGYDCLRIDAFPHLVAAGADGQRPEWHTVLPQGKRFMWGNHRPVAVDPGAGLVEFVGMCRDRGIFVALSTWFNDDALHRREEIRLPADYARIWAETLELLDEHDLLDAVAWVDLCNEFPMDVWAWGAAPTIYGDRVTSTPGLLLKRARQPWTASMKRTMEQFFDDGIAPLRARWPHLRYTYSFSAFRSDDVQTLDVSAFDLAEPHVWASDDEGMVTESLQTLPLFEVPFGVRLHARRAARLWPKKRAEWTDILDRRTDYWAGWAEARDLPLVTSECWGPINYDDVPGMGGAEWGWVKEVCEVGVELAVAKGWRGVSTNNFAQPHFEGLWADAAWHRDLNRLIRGIDTPVAPPAGAAGGAGAP